MIIYHTFGGRLGNQLFQAAFVTTISKPNEKIFFTRMDHVLKILPQEFSGKSHFNGLAYKIFDRLIVPLIIQPIVHGLHLFTLVREIPDSDKIEYRKGLFNNIKWVEGYFQGEVFFDKSKVKNWKIESTLIAKAKESLLKLVPQHKKTVAIHWRQGDYKDFVVFGEKDPSLPVEYFNNAIEEIKKTVKDPFFVLFSDEPETVAEKLKLETSEYAVSHQSAEVDLLMISLCDHLILSNSTMSWWAGFWAQGPGKIIIAPKYWMGWKSKKYFPEAIEPSFVTLLDPNI